MVRVLPAKVLNRLEEISYQVGLVCAGHFPLDKTYGSFISFTFRIPTKKIKILFLDIRKLLQGFKSNPYKFYGSFLVEPRLQRSFLPQIRTLCPSQPVDRAQNHSLLHALPLHRVQLLPPVEVLSFPSIGLGVNGNILQTRINLVLL